jgi:hypothetical protein
MPEKFVYSAIFTDERGCPVKPGMTRKEREDDPGTGPGQLGGGAMTKKPTKKPVR